MLFEGDVWCFYCAGHLQIAYYFKPLSKNSLADGIISAAASTIDGSISYISLHPFEMDPVHCLAGHGCVPHRYPFFQS
jgi:hypothetical protein